MLLQALLGISAHAPDNQPFPAPASIWIHAISYPNTRDTQLGSLLD